MCVKCKEKLVIWVVLIQSLSSMLCYLPKNHSYAVLKAESGETTYRDARIKLPVFEESIWCERLMQAFEANFGCERSKRAFESNLESEYLKRVFDVSVRCERSKRTFEANIWRERLKRVFDANVRSEHLTSIWTRIWCDDLKLLVSARYHSVFPYIHQEVCLIAFVWYWTWANTNLWILLENYIYILIIKIKGWSLRVYL